MTGSDGDQLVDIEQAGSGRLLHRLVLSDVPQPGRWLDLDGTSYLVLQRRHRYRLVQGRYRLARVVLQVKAQRQPADAHWWRNRWVIGDPTCTYNALSPLLRCAVLPEGPCSGCLHHRGR
ncbi:MAG: DUF6464 family protein [Synechococcus sp.]